MESNYVLILITTANLTEAKKISQALVEQKKAACVNIVPKVNSLFWWEGKIDSAQESLIIAKTKHSLLPELIKLTKKLHSYEVPEIIALPVVGGNEEYLKWVAESLR